MRQNDLDARIQEYLDGRMDAADREEFESLIGEDPALAARINEYRDVGRLLKDGPVDLPPGFHARARARFEASRHGRPVWRRFMSLEAAGLATAAVLLAVIMFPDVRDSGLRAPETPERTGSRRTPEIGATAETRAVEIGPAAGLTPEEPVPPPRPEVEKETRHEKGPPEPQAEQFAIAPPAAEDAVRNETAEPESKFRRYAPSKSGKGTDTAARAPERQKTESMQTEGTFQKKGGRLREAESDMHLRAVGEMEDSYSHDAAGTELPAGVLAAGSMTVLDAMSDLPPDAPDTLRRAIARLGTDFSSARVVLLGPRAGMTSCFEASYLVEGARIVILPSRGRAGEQGPGCALVVPLRPVVVVVGD